MKFTRKVVRNEYLSTVVDYERDTLSFTVRASDRGIEIFGSILAVDIDAYLKILQVTKFAWIDHRSIKETGDESPSIPEVDYVTDIK